MSEIHETHTLWLNGHPKSRSFSRNGKLEGEIKGWYGNGQLHWHQFYRNGKLEGESKRWYSNGQLECHKFYRNDKLEGECKWWYDDGQLTWHLFYRNGKREGECKWWHEDGTLISHKYSINSKVFDDTFSIWKKCKLLKLKRVLYRKACYRKYILIFNEKLITDLSKIISDYL